MVLPKIYINNYKCSTGFTLMEVLMVLAMLGFIASATMMFSVGFFQSELLHTEESTLISVLQTARSKAMQNVNGVAHGVAIDPNGVPEFVIFSGSNFSTADVSTVQSISRSANFIIATSAVREIVFSQLSGEVVLPGEIVLIDSMRNSASTTITVNYEGAIY